MNTYLLTWRPDRYDWMRLPYLIHLSGQGWPIVHEWCCHTTRSIREGDRCFLLRRDPGASGIMASGRIVSRRPHVRRRRTKDRTRNGKASLYVDVQFDVLLDPDSEPLLSQSRLSRGSVTSIPWDTARSGTRIPEEAAEQLEALWQKHVARIPKRVACGP